MVVAGQNDGWGVVSVFHVSVTPKHECQHRQRVTIQAFPVQQYFQREAKR